VSTALAGYTLSDTVRENHTTCLLRGTRNSDGTRVIVKTLRAEHPSLAQIARLRHEHAVLAAVEVPEVVRALDLVKHGRGLALVRLPARFGVGQHTMTATTPTGAVASATFTVVSLGGLRVF